METIATAKVLIEYFDERYRHCDHKITHHLDLITPKMDVLETYGMPDDVWVQEQNFWIKYYQRKRLQVAKMLNVLRGEFRDDCEHIGIDLLNHYNEQARDNRMGVRN